MLTNDVSPLSLLTVTESHNASLIGALKCCSLLLLLKLLTLQHLLSWGSQAFNQAYMHSALIRSRSYSKNAGNFATKKKKKNMVKF